MRRLRVQFSMRTLLIVQLAIACLIAVLVVWRSRSESQRKLVESLAEYCAEAVPARISIDLLRGSVETVHDPTSDWLAQHLGENSIFCLEQVHFKWHHRPVDEIWLRPLVHIRYLSAQKSNISDALFCCIPTAKLEYADISDSQLGRGALEHLATGPNLQRLRASNMRFEDADLMALGKLPQLRRLNVPHNRVMGTCFDPVRFPALMHLDLDSCPISEAGFESIAGMQNLRALSLQGTCLTDKSLEILASLENLESLTIANTKITPAAMHTLATHFPKMNGGGADVSGTPIATRIDELGKLRQEHRSKNRK